jgi:hypothetical protein
VAQAWGGQYVRGSHLLPNLALSIEDEDDHVLEFKKKIEVAVLVKD